MKEETKAKLEQAKAEATEIAKKHMKAALLELNEKVIPTLIDAATSEIPGQIDDGISAVAKPIIKEALDSAIEAI